jgi:transposase
MTCEEAEALYAEGKDAVVSYLVELSTRVRSLEDRLSKDSHNSHKPPSSDTFKPPKSLRPMPSHSLKSGGQKGHKGQTREFSATIDKVALHLPEQCQKCGGSLAEASATADDSVAERRQVMDLPPIRLQVTEHRAPVVVCPHCQCQNKKAFPQNVSAPVVYGSGLCAWIVYLHLWHLIPYARLCQMLKDLTGQSVSEGTVAGVLRRAYDKLEPVETAIGEAIVASPVAGADETKLKGAGWLHVLRTDSLTHLGCHAKRGKEGMEAIGLLPRFTGTLTHDCWSGYFHFGKNHALCGAHLLRDLVFVEERFGPKDKGGHVWATEMKQWMLDAKEAAGKAREQGNLAPENCVALVQRYDAILANAYKSHPPPDPMPTKTPFWLLLLDRLRDYRQYVLTFVRDVRVPFDNNGSERDIRMTKVRQKVSGCFRGEEAPDWYCRIRGYLSTIRKQNIDILTALTALFDAEPVIPALV